MSRDVEDRDDDLPEDDDLLEDDDLEEAIEDLRVTGRTGFLSGLLLGALLGAGVALLVAPERGDVTRRRLTRGVRKLADDTRGQVEDWTDDARRELRRRRRRLRRRLHR